MQKSCSVVRTDWMKEETKQCLWSCRGGSNLTLYFRTELTAKPHFKLKMFISPAFQEDSCLAWMSSALFYIFLKRKMINKNKWFGFAGHRSPQCINRTLGFDMGDVPTSHRQRGAAPNLMHFDIWDRHTSTASFFNRLEKRKCVVCLLLASSFLTDKSRLMFLCL